MLVTMSRWTTIHDTIPGVQPIAPSIWTCDGFSKDSGCNGVSAPSLILLTTWTGAHGKHISTYIKKYATLFPSSPIMIITTSSADFLFRTSRQKQHRLAPALDYITKAQSVPLCKTGGILVHAFSEGGCNKLCELAVAYKASQRGRIPISALYLDSTPGQPRYKKLCSALAKSFPPVPVLQQLAKFVAIVMLGLLWILYHAFVGYENNPITKARRQLLDKELFDYRIPRCYLYSEADQLISYEDIADHARDSSKVNIPTEEIVFEESDHVHHARRYKERYWSAVLRVWEQRNNCEKDSC